METSTYARRIRLRPRLEAVAALIGEVETLADIGCDHGRLSAALLQRGAAQRAIATDISAPSLQKAAQLSAAYGLAARMQTRLGDGLAPLTPGEADAAAICGMGGELIAGMLAAATPPLRGAALAVLQPMRGVEELREFLWRSGYRVVQERVARERGRYYQALSIAVGEEMPFPAGWPTGFWSVGAHAVGEPLFLPMLEQMLHGVERRCRMAQGTAGEAMLCSRREALRRVREIAMDAQRK